jgi:sugar phosphate isomerase/epimerase
MKLAFSTNAFLQFRLEDALDQIAEIGYRGVEILADVPHAWPSGLLARQKEAIRRALDRHGLAISNVNAFMMNAVADPRQPYVYPAWTEPYAPYRAIRREHTKRALHLAREIGAPNITTEPGGPVFAGQTWPQAASLFYEELMPCVELAEKLEVRILVEPEPELLVETFDQFLELAGRINSPWLGLNFDIGHAYCVGQDPQDWVVPMAPHTRHYHLEDIAATRVHKHLIPGHGAIDLKATLAAIRATAYQGWLTVELYPYIDQPQQAARAAFDYLHSLATTLEIPLG